MQKVLNYSDHRQHKKKYITALTEHPRFEGAQITHPDDVTNPWWEGLEGQFHCYCMWNSCSVNNRTSVLLGILQSLQERI